MTVTEREETIHCESYTLVERVEERGYNSLLFANTAMAGTVTLGRMNAFAFQYAQLSRFQEVYFFTRLLVHKPFRDKKLGSFLLEKAIEHARAEEMPIVNSVNPYGDLTLEELSAFYERHGFVQQEDGGLLWVPKHTRK